MVEICLSIYNKLINKIIIYIIHFLNVRKYFKINIRDILNNL